MKKIAAFAYLATASACCMAGKYGINEALEESSGSGSINAVVFLIVGAVAGLVWSEAKTYQTAPCVALGAAAGLVLSWLALP